MGVLADIAAGPVGQMFYGGRTKPPPTGLLGQAIAAMASNSFSEYLGTNINEMTLPPSSSFYYGDGSNQYKIGIWESTPSHQIQDWCGKMWYDQVNGILGCVGTTNGAVGHPEASKEILFRCQSNDFLATINPTGKSEGHLYDGNVSRPDADGYVYRRAYTDGAITRAKTTGPRAGAYSTFVTIAALGGSPSASIEVFPDMGTKGALVVVDDTGKMWTVDLATAAVTAKGTIAGLTNYPITTYLSGPKKVMFGGGSSGTGINTRMYLLDAAGTITEVAHTPPAGMRLESSASGGTCVPHPDGTGILVFSIPLLRVYKLAWDGTWTDLGPVASDLTPTNYMARTIACSLHGQGAVALFLYIGVLSQVNPLTRCKFLLWKA